MRELNLRKSKAKSGMSLCLILTLFLLASTPSWAKAIPLNEGEPAPFSGQLLSPEDAVELLQKIERAEFEKKLELDYLKRLHEAELRAVKPKWHEHPAFVVTVTVVSVIGIFTVTAYGLDAVANR